MGRPASQRTRLILPSIAAGYALVLTYLLVTPVPLWFLGQTGSHLQGAIDSSLSDLIQHAAAYGLLGCLSVWVLKSARSPRSRHWLALVMVHGTVAECLQYLVPERFFGWSDLAANLFGAAAGITAGFVLLGPVRRMTGRARMESAPLPV